ncbi:MAG TPA: filamentous hemagglutinin family protein [Chthoniobacterales bacterium]|nr:filamentous hemagglutinin family protein [Chthoniobacterales bacterium]
MDSSLAPQVDRIPAAAFPFQIAVSGAIIIWAGDTNPAKVPNPPLDKIANIDAGKGSKTELVAPAQLFLVNNETAVVTLDPAAVSTGNDIATLPAVAGAPPPTSI